MFKLNLKIAWRNLWKNKVYAAINIGGLALGLTAFVLMLLYINHEESYDTWSPELENVYQVRERHDFFTADNQQHWQDNVDSRMGVLIKEKMPQVVASTVVQPDWDFNYGYSIKPEHSNPQMITDVKDADSAFFRVFDYTFLQGNPETALKAPGSIVLKQQLAIKLFGTDKVLGKTLKVVMWRTDKGTDLTVTGVVEEPATPQSVFFNGLMRTGMDEGASGNASNTQYRSVYAKMNGPIDTALFQANLQAAYVQHKKASFILQKRNYTEYYKNGKFPGLKVISLNSVHKNPPLKSSWAEKLKPVLGICVFLLLVSVINFINLATAQSVQRAKEVGVKKVLGSHKRQLVWQFLTESALQSVVSLFLCIILIEVLLPAFNHHFNVTLSFWHNTQLVATITQLFSLFVLVTLLAGFYPAWVLSNYNPVAVLKGNYGNGLKGIALRNILVVFQFVISVTFIISIGIMGMQMRYINSRDLGFDRSNLVNLKTNYDEGFAEKLRKIPGITYVGTTTQVMGNAFNVPEEIIYRDQKINVNTVTVSMEALPALGVEVLKGRMFSTRYKQDTVNTVILNQSAEKLMGKNMVGQSYYLKDNDRNLNYQVVGIIKDYHNESFDKAVLPTIYKVTHLGGTSSTNNMLLKLNTRNIKPVMQKVDLAWKATYPDYPMSYETLDEAFSGITEDDNRFMNMIIVFSILSISLSLLGLFALSTFVAKRKTKEIAVRKVLGASNVQIINLLNRSFLILVIVANLISWPVAYIIIKKWLDSFAYRIEMPLLPFLSATIISIVIAVLTVSIQARKAAGTDPVNALKYE